MWETELRGRYQDSWRSSLDVPLTQRFPSPYDSTISRRISSIAQKYGVALTGSPTRKVSDYRETKALIDGIRKKYLVQPASVALGSTDEADFQVSVSVSEAPLAVDEGVQTFVPTWDRESQTDSKPQSASPPRRQRQWDIAQLPPLPVRRSTDQPPERVPSRRRLRPFDEYLQEHPIVVDAGRERGRSLFERDERLRNLQRRREEAHRRLREVEETRGRLAREVAASDW